MVSVFVEVLLRKMLETIYHKVKVVLQCCECDLVLYYLTKSEREIKDVKTQLIVFTIQLMLNHSLPAQLFLT